MLKKVTVIAATAAALLAGAGAGAAAAATSSGPGFHQVACVEFGKPGSVVGNVMLYDWNGGPCPKGTYRVDLSGAADFDPADVDPIPVDKDAPAPAPAG